MPYSEVDFVSQSEIHYMDGRDDTIVISIRNSNSDPARVSTDFKDVLFLEFDNVDHYSRHEKRFSRFDAEAIIAFAAKHENTATRIVVNCMAGETRSAAVAVYLSQKYSVELTKEYPNMSAWVLHVLDDTEDMAAYRLEKSQSTAATQSGAQ